MQKLFSEPLAYIFAVYSLSFFLMAGLILVGARNAERVPLVKAMYWLAAFGLTHGACEAVDLVRFGFRTESGSEPAGLVWLSASLLILSFFILGQFAAKLFSGGSSGPAMRFLPWALVLAAGAFAAVRGKTGISDVALASRYTMGFAGAALSAYALYLTGRTMSSLGSKKLDAGIWVASVGFACYAVFGGLLVNPIGGWPIQLFRGACAVVIGISMFGIIAAFKFVRNTNVSAAATT